MKPEPRTRAPSAKVVESLGILASANGSASRSRSKSSMPESLIVKLKLKSLLPTPPQTPSPLDPTTTTTLRVSKKSYPSMVRVQLAPKVPTWMFKPSMKAVTPPLPPSPPPTLNSRIYADAILKLPPSIRHKIYSLVFQAEPHTALTTFGNYRQWNAPDLLQVNAHFLEDTLPVYLSNVTLVARGGEEFQVLGMLSARGVRDAVKALYFPRYFLHSGVVGRKDLEIMQACPALREVTIDIRIDDLLRPKLNRDGAQVSWESTPVKVVAESYILDDIAKLPKLVELKYRLVSNCYGWKHQFVELVLAELAKYFKTGTGGGSFSCLWVMSGLVVLDTLQEYQQCVVMDYLDL